METVQSPADPVGLYWTNHPLMDAAIAGICVFSKVKRPEEITGQHLEDFKDWAIEYYFSPELTSWLSVVFTSNFLNPSFTRDKKKAVLCKVLTAYKCKGELTERCTFFPHLPALERVARDRVPMLMGRGPMNFYPDGQEGLPLSGLAITMLQGLSLAAPLVSGRALVLETDQPKLLLKVIKVWQGELHKRMSLSLSENKKQKIWAHARTRLVETMREILSKTPIKSYKNKKAVPEEFQGSATIHHLSNSGQGPDAQIYTLQQPIITFLQLAEQEYPVEWNRILHSKRREATKDKDPEFGFRNDIDEELFALPDSAPLFLRRHFMGLFTQVARPIKASKPKAKKGNQQPVSDLDLNQVWGLVTLFLQEVIGMEKTRVEAIQKLGNRLAHWILEENDKRLYRSIYEVRGSGPLRHILIKAANNKLKLEATKGESNPPLITGEEYLEVFTEQDEIIRADFTLARDLLKMQIIQVLQENDFFLKNAGDPEIKNAELNIQEEK